MKAAADFSSQDAHSRANAPHLAHTDAGPQQAPDGPAPTRLHTLANASPQATAQRALQRRVSASLAAQRAADAPLQAAKDEEVQMAKDEEIQMAKDEEIQMAKDEEEVPAQTKKAPVQRQKNKTGLPDALKTGVEALSGHSLDDVRVHYNSAKPASLQAHAFAQGSNIHIAPGQEKHLPHEAWHTVQQRQGRVAPTIQAHGVSINDDAGLEHEADVKGAEALAVGQRQQQ